MARLTLLTIGLAAFCAFNGVNCDGFVQTLELSNIDGGFDVTASRALVNLTKTVGSAKNLGVQDSNAKFTPRFALQPRQVATNRATITYRLGQRINGDRVVATNSQNQQWTVAQNVTQNITYPRSGVGAVITYIEIVVNQSSNLGRGFVTSGGIGQRQIVITIEAQKTLYFLQTTTIYGY